ncbi:MAG: YebC/PmpR family DNA-binding transcriptional regulator [Caulobacterales bacterium]
MAGHSKFKNIMYRKGAQDKKRAQHFTKIAREIQTAVSAGGPDPTSNAALYRAIALARAENMPKDNVQRAIDRALGGSGEQLEYVRYEGFGPAGVGLIVETLTDNRNRTAADVRSTFTKLGGNLATTNAVTSGFSRVGEIRYPAKAASEDAMMDAAIEAGAEDCTLESLGEDEGEQHVVICEFSELSAVSDALQKKFGDPASVKIIWKPQNTIPVDGDAASTLMKLLSTLDDLDDVQNVFANFELSEEEMAKLTA